MKENVDKLYNSKEWLNNFEKNQYHKSLSYMYEHLNEEWEKIKILIKYVT